MRAHLRAQHLLVAGLCICAAGVSAGSAGISRLGRARLGSTAIRASTSTDTGAATKVAKVVDKTGGAAVLIDGATVSVGDADLIAGGHLRVGIGERWGLVGVNGCGKSTLLRAILRNDPRFAEKADSISVRSGTIAISQTLSVGYLEQTAVTGSERSVKEEVMSRMERLVAAKDAYDVASERVSNGDCSDAAIELLGETEAAYGRAGGYDSDKLVANVLRGLGFSEADEERMCAEFSGGWRMRIGLARLLLSNPELLILDEPSNHLDSSAKRWLGNYLKAYEGTLLIVSHDESILDAAATSIAEVDSETRTIESFKSMNLAQWREERVLRKTRKVVEEERRQAEIDRLQGFIDRFGAKATKASASESKRKAIERIKAEAPPKLDISTASEGGGSMARKLILKAAPKGAVKQLELKSASFGWQALQSGAAPQLTDVSMYIERGWRVAVVGPNGAGKSTLLAALSGALSLVSGKREEGDGVVMGMFRQDLAQDLDQNARPVDLVQRVAWEYSADATTELAFGALGALGLTGARASGRTIGQLSGGEKARVAMATFSVKPHNILLLDEPTNHIDAQMAEVLIDALSDFPGAVVTVSHDRNFVEALNPTHVVSVRNGQVVMEERSLRDSDWFHEDVTATAELIAPPPAAAAIRAIAEKANAEAAAAGVDDKAMRKARTAAEKSAVVLERTMDKLGDEIKALEKLITATGSDYGEAAALQAEIDAKNDAVNAAMIEWEKADTVANAPPGKVP